MKTIVTAWLVSMALVSSVTAQGGMSGHEIVRKIITAAGGRVTDLKSFESGRVRTRQKQQLIVKRFQDSKKPPRVSFNSLNNKKMLTSVLRRWINEIEREKRETNENHNR